MFQAKSFMIKVVIFTLFAIISVLLYENQKHRKFSTSKMSGGFENLKNSSGGNSKDDYVKNPMPGPYNIFLHNDDK